MTGKHTLTTDPEYDAVKVMAPYAEEPERATVDDDGVIHDHKGSRFDERTYWVVAGSQEINGEPVEA